MVDCLQPNCDRFFAACKCVLELTLAHGSGVSVRGGAGKAEVQWDNGRHLCCVNYTLKMCYRHNSTSQIVKYAHWDECYVVQPAKPMFPVPPFQLMQLDSRIVQIDWFAELLLVSTLTRCYLCDTIKEQYRQIGHKLREGEFGACFYHPADSAVPRRSEPRNGVTDRTSFISVGEAEESRSCEGLQDVRLFSARPGSRLWEVDAQGTVLRTHQFKDALAIPPARIVNLSESDCTGSQSSASTDESQPSSWTSQSFNFPRLYTISKNFLMTFRQSGVYIFKPEGASVVLWSDRFKDIVDGKVVKDTMYLYTVSGDVRALTLTSIEDFLVKLYFQKQYSLCAELCFTHEDYLLSQIAVSPKICILSDLARKVDNLELTERISPLLEAISKLYDDKRSSIKLKSGIVVIGNQHYLAKEDENQLHSRLATFIEENALKEKSRSLNTSPKVMRRRRSAASVVKNDNKSGSTSSLPDLLQNSNSDSSRTLSDDEHNVINSPEARQVLKEIGQSMSGKLVTGTKTLKEKWQMLNKMKFLGSNNYVELVGIRPQNHKNDDDKQLDPHDENTEDVVYNKSVHRHPALDVSPVLEVCQEIQSSDVETITVNCAKFFSCLKSLFKEFCYGAEATGKARTSENMDISLVLQEVSKGCDLNFLNASLIHFPFHHYFQGDSLRLVYDTLHNLFQFPFIIDFVKTLESEELLPVPDQLLNVYKLAELELDAKMCQFLHGFSDIIDPNTMLQNIKCLNMSCYYKSLVVLLDIYQKGKQLHIKDAEDENCCLMMQLNIILMMLRMDQVESCSKMREAVDLKDVFYLILRVQEMCVESGVEVNKAKMDSHRMFLSFLDKSPHSSEGVSSTLNDPELSAFLIAAYEELNSNVAHSCRCGYPAPHPAEPQFPAIGHSILRHLLTVGSSSIKKFLHKIPGLWRSYLDMKGNSFDTSNLPLIIHLGDIVLLEKVLSQMSSELWADAFEMFAKFRSGLCLNCKKQATWTACDGGISWSLFGMLAVKCLGPSSALSYVSKYADDIRPGELDSRQVEQRIQSTHCGNLRNPTVIRMELHNTTRLPLQWPPKCGAAGKIKCRVNPQQFDGIVRTEVVQFLEVQ
ncbi:hypothetical protein PR048_016755 [Dryococelus australis]|uniref:HPS5 TPR domain-containing protein n=1 Tax=Dryococelus australis TaxID=614101 RepID=A0ABQ9H7P3_9NEOP|nr:hypothetical protein PR048_016755 [Dryococelus australis]